MTEASSAVEKRTISFGDKYSVTAFVTTPEQPVSDLVVVYAPGAGSNLYDPFGAYLAKFLLDEGYTLWRFQFPYVEAGRTAPDPPRILEATWGAVIQDVLDEIPEARIVTTGRSMGGRIASMIAAEDAPIAGLVLYAYPLIPPGRPVNRSEHFPHIKTPTLLLCGTRDMFGTPEQLTQAAALIPNATLHLLEGADHGFAAVKASGRTRQDVWQECCEATLAFLKTL